MCPRRFALVCCSLLLPGVLGVSGCMSRRTAPPAAPVQRELPADVAEAVEPFKGFDNRPYEFIWNPRTERPRPLVSFDQTMGWKVEAETNLVAGFDRSDEEQIWGAYVGKLAVSQAGSTGTVRVRPPEPMAIREHFDTVSLWVLPRLQSPAVPGAPTPVLSILVRDAQQNEVRIPMGALDWDGWRLVVRRIGGPDVPSLQQPCDFTGFEWTGLGAGPAFLYVDSLAFYSEHLERLSPVLRPRANLEWPLGHSLGLHAGKEVLTFPVRSETVLPPPPADGLQPSVVEEAPDAYLFSCQLPEGVLAYRVDCRETFPALSVSWSGEQLGDLFLAGGIHGSRDFHDAVAVSRREGDRVRIEYNSGAIYEFHMRGASLVLDASLRGGGAKRFDSGRMEWTRPLHFVKIPTLTVEGRTDLAEVAWGPGGEGAPGSTPGAALFVSRVLDGYRSAASEIVPGTNGPLGSALYRPLTSGRRGDLYERLVFTVATRIEQVLPSLPNPAAVRGPELIQRLWVDPPAADELRGIPSRAAQLSGMGITNLVMGHGEEVWRDIGENTTLRTRASQELGGDAALAERLAALQGGGWRVGLSANYSEISALSEHWSPDRIRRSSGGDLQRAPSGRYGIKVPAALELQSTLLPHWSKVFAPRLAYVGPLTRDPPWAATDFDDRVPGSGRFAQNFYGVGELLLREARLLDAPVLGSGAGALFYAGLADGLVSGPEDTHWQNTPYLPIFELSRVHPLCVRFGAGELDPATPPQAQSAALDRLLAAQIAYGCAGRMPPADWPPALQARAYFMMQAVQAHLAGRRPDRIAYWDGARYVSTSQALQDGSAERSLLYVLYEHGAEVWVNGSPRETWLVRVGRETWLLPPYGWVVAGGGNRLLSASALVEGRRVDFLRSADYQYWDGRGLEKPFAMAASAGPVVIRVMQGAEGWSLEVRVPGGSRRFGVGDVTGRNPVMGAATLYNEAGQVIGTQETEPDALGIYWVENETPVHRCVWTLKERTPEDP